MKCLNCKIDFNGKFCNNCGQKASTRKIDLHYLVNEVPNSVLQVNRGFFFTVKKMATKPGYSIREFLEGKRKNYYKPVAFLIVATTLYVLSTIIMGTNTFFTDIILGWKEGATAQDDSSYSVVFNWIAENEVYFMLLVIPVFSVASFLAFFRSGYNYFEHLVANLYITGQQMLIYFIFAFIFFKDNLLLAVPLLLAIFYNFWAFCQLFERKKTWMTLLLILLTYIIFLCITFLIPAIVVGLST